MQAANSNGAGQRIESSIDQREVYRKLIQTIVLIKTVFIKTVFLDDHIFNQHCHGVATAQTKADDTKFRFVLLQNV